MEYFTFATLLGASLTEYSAYNVIIGISLTVILSYIFSVIAKKTNIPSVLLLILLGVGAKYGMEKLGANFDTADTALKNILEILGTVGLIMIVLEAALDLELTKEKRPLIIKSFFVALVALIVSSFAIAYLLDYFIMQDFTTALVYAIPLSIMSSAIIIPSVVSLSESKKEFLIYESTFSDILGIMFFYFLKDNLGEGNSTESIIFFISINILVTLVLSVVVSYLLVLLFQRLQSGAKLFLLISVLILLYAVGKTFHLSSLVIILIFGLVLNNHKVFFRGKLKEWIELNVFNSILKNFHTVTLESAFVVRTFFFVIFGLTLDLGTLWDAEVALISLSIVLSLYVVRLLCLKLFNVKSILPGLFVAPRGLITILLFFAIPIAYQTDDFNSGILLFTILTTSIIMTVALIIGGEEDDIEELDFPDWEVLDNEIEVVTEEVQ